jgi:uncharacterized protein (TIGR00251 family)
MAAFDVHALKVVAREGAVRIEVRARPRAHKSRLVGERDGALEVQLAAPPVDGAANEELVKTLARALGVAKSAVRIVRGEGGRDKLVEISGIGEDELRRAVGADRGREPPLRRR